MREAAVVPANRGTRVFRKRGSDLNIIRARGNAVRGVILALIAAVITACGDGSSGPAAQISVPNVVGEAQTAATTAITGAGLTVGTVTQDPETQTVPGVVHWLS